MVFVFFILFEIFSVLVSPDPVSRAIGNNLNLGEGAHGVGVAEDVERFEQSQAGWLVVRPRARRRGGPCRWVAYRP